MAEVNNHCAMSDSDEEEEKTYGGGKTFFITCITLWDA